MSGREVERESKRDRERVKLRGSARHKKPRESLLCQTVDCECTAGHLLLLSRICWPSEPPSPSNRCLSDWLDCRKSTSSPWMSAPKTGRRYCTFVHNICLWKTFKQLCKNCGITLWRRFFFKSLRQLRRHGNRFSEIKKIQRLVVAFGSFSVLLPADVREWFASALRGFDLF